ncbi:MAG TPA: PIN domain-containing protein, partial [Spirochaetota bacterium]|nr:PIN domain-containing protein [Spirochaetota bacterium]
TPGTQIQNEEILRKALKIYCTDSASFGDCLIYATVKHSNIKEIVTSDKHFNSFDLKVTHC